MPEITLTLTQEAELARRSKTDAHAFTSLYERYYPRVYKYIYFRVGDHSAAEDLVSTIFLKALEKIDSYQEKRGEFSLWLFRIAHNVLVDSYRKRARVSAMALKEIDLEPTGERFPEHQALKQQSDDELLDQIALLTEREQEIIGLKFGAGLGNKKIAVLVDLKENHVAVILYRAMKKLRKGLTEESER